MTVPPRDEKMDTGRDTTAPDIAEIRMVEPLEATPEGDNSPAGALAWLLAVLDNAVRRLNQCGDDVDALVLEAHRAALAAGREWPGMPIASATDLGFRRHMESKK